MFGGKEELFDGWIQRPRFYADYLELHLVLRLRVHGCVPSFPPYVFIA
jgi:hypothetical protein